MAANYEKVPEQVYVNGDILNKLVEALNQQREKDDKRFEALEERIKKLEERD